jgi:hypothetical protein
MIYGKLARLAFRFAARYVRRRYRRQIRIGAGVAVAGLAIAGFIASRNVPEG